MNRSQINILMTIICYIILSEFQEFKIVTEFRQFGGINSVDLSHRIDAIASKVDGIGANYH